MNCWVEGPGTAPTVVGTTVVVVSVSLVLAFGHAENKFKEIRMFRGKSRRILRKFIE